MVLNHHGKSELLHRNEKNCISNFKTVANVANVSKDIVFKIFIDKSKDSVFFNDYSCKDISESLFGSFLI